MYHPGMTKMLERDKKQVIVRLTPETKRAIRMIAAKNDLSVSRVIANLIEDSLVIKNSS
mgnify:FL=1